MRQIAKTACDLLMQLGHLAEQMTDKEYRMDLDILNSNSIGKHFRHVSEFFTILSENDRSGKLSYDKRRHDPVLETDRELMLLKIKELQKKISESPSDDPLELEVSYDLEADQPVRVPTSYRRELIYNIEHAIHHMAIMRIALKNDFPHIPVDKNFGLAYSTIKYHSS